MSIAIDQRAGRDLPPSTTADFSRDEPWALVARPAQDERPTSDDPVPFDIIEGLKLDFLHWCAAVGITDNSVLGRVFDAICSYDPKGIAPSVLTSLQQSFGVVVSVGIAETDKSAFVMFSNIEGYAGLRISFHVPCQVIKPPPLRHLEIPEDIDLDDSAVLDALDAKVMNSALTDAGFIRARRNAELCAWVDPKEGEGMQRRLLFLEILRLSGCADTEVAGSVVESVPAPALSSGQIRVYRFPHYPFS